MKRWLSGSEQSSNTSKKIQTFGRKGTRRAKLLTLLMVMMRTGTTMSERAQLRKHQVKLIQTIGRRYQTKQKRLKLLMVMMQTGTIKRKLRKQLQNM